MSVKTIFWLCCMAISAASTLAQDASSSEQSAERLTGTWHCQFETPFGMQTYHLHVAIKGAGNATMRGEVESRDEERKVEFVDVKVDGDSIAFAEVRQFGERKFRIEYKGELKGKGLVLIRSFGQRGNQESLATRDLPEPPPKDESAPVVEVQIDRIIKDAFRDSFLVGMAGDLPSRYSDEELELAAQHFAAITPENCMKPERVHPAEDRWTFERSDALVGWAQKNGMTIHGHTLVWHAQTPDWFFEGRDPETIKRRMKEHIETLAGRYKGKLQSWDVVNEAISDGGDSETAKTENLRNSNWLQTLGPEFLTLAFKFARDADPDAILYYNDYNIESGPKHASSMVLLKRLLAEGAPIDAVGIQGHWRSGRIPFEDIEKAIMDYASLGLKVSITELDVTIRGQSGGQFGRRRFRNSAPPSVEDLNAQADDYAKLFAIFKKHEDVIERVTFWGLNDRRTWRWGQHPLLFDANNNPKPAYAAIVNGNQRDGSTGSSKPVVFTTQDDHRNMLGQLGITKLRPGRSGNADAPNGANYDEAKANPYPVLPDILVTTAGEKVTTPEQWNETRRPELVRLLETHLYGRIPETVPDVKWEVVETREVEAGGKPAIQKHILGTVDNSACPDIKVNISMSLTLPKDAKGSVPVLITFGWTPFEPNPFARFGRRGGNNGPRPPTKRDLLIAAGWGCAMINPSTIQDDAGGWQRRRFSGSAQPEDVEPTGAGLTRGIIGLTNLGQPRTPDQWGALRAWGWGASRALDYFEEVPEVDAKRVGIAGVSRYGKAALVTMAFDERFAMGLIASSGAGGTALHRRNFGESLENLAGSGEYHWMCGNYLQYAAEDSSLGRKTPDDLPVDSHMMLALCAPRLTFISHGIPERGDAHWLDHQGSFMAAVAAQPVYRLLGAKDLGRSDDYLNERMPAVNVDLLDGSLAWRQHDGGHTDGPNVEHFIRWAESQWTKEPQASADDAGKRSLKDAVRDRFKLGVGVSHRTLRRKETSSPKGTLFVNILCF